MSDVITAQLYRLCSMTATRAGRKGVSKGVHEDVCRIADHRPLQTMHFEGSQLLRKHGFFHPSKVYRHTGG